VLTDDKNLRRFASGRGWFGGVDLEIREYGQNRKFLFLPGLLVPIDVLF
jgi:hypothetical protein